MKISAYSNDRLGEFIAGNPDGWPYRNTRQLVEFFNKFGFREVYEGQSFPSRPNYAKDKIGTLNGNAKLKEVIHELLNSSLWIDLVNNGHTVEKAVLELNELLKPDGFEVLRDGNFYKVCELYESIIDVENKFEKSTEISELFIEEQIKKCREKVESGDYSGAITNARTLIESVCLKIERDLDPFNANENDGDLMKLFNRVRKLLNFDPSRKDINASLKQVLSGLSNIVNGLATMRNKMSDAHGPTYKAGRHHAKLAVNSAKTLADFLFDSLNYQVENGRIKKLK